MRDKLVFISGKYTADTPKEIERNIQVARKANIAVWDAGFTGISPHMNTARFEKDCSCKYFEYILGDLHILKRCDAVYQLEGWQTSMGAQVEWLVAKMLKIPIVASTTELMNAFNGGELI